MPAVLLAIAYAVVPALSGVGSSVFNLYNASALLSASLHHDRTERDGKTQQTGSSGSHLSSLSSALIRSISMR